MSSERRRHQKTGREHIFVTPLPILLLFAVAACALIPASVHAQSRVGLGSTVFYETGQLEATQSDGVETADHSFRYRNTNFVSLRLHYLRPFDEELLLGFGLDFQGIYRANPIDIGDPDAPDGPYELGPLIETQAIAEWRLPVTEHLNFGLGGHIGLATLFPTGDLASEITTLQDVGINVWHLPRFGWGLGAHTVATWAMGPRLSMRVDLGVQWQTISLFRIDESFGDSNFQLRWSTASLRARVGLALELRL